MGNPYVGNPSNPDQGRNTVLDIIEYYKNYLNITK